MASDRPAQPPSGLEDGLSKSGGDTRSLQHSRWSMGILNDKYTVEVPGSVLLLASNRNEPLGMRNMPGRVSHSSIPVGIPFEAPSAAGAAGAATQATPESQTAATNNDKPTPPEKRRTPDGAIILDPQPEESANDPLNWPIWRRNTALLSLGFYCMIGGGMAPSIAAGFTNVAQDFGVSIESVPLTTGLFMMGLGLGSVVASPTAILYGKRPVYLVSTILFIGASLWAGFSPSFGSLIAARIVQGMAVSPVECLPSATIAEIFFLHERAYRVGIYTLLLLGGKNLIPLLSAIVIGRLSWRWVFFIVAMVVGFAGILLFFFVPETFWDRTPTKRPTRRASLLHRISFRHGDKSNGLQEPAAPATFPPHQGERSASPGIATRHTDLHVGFAPDSESTGIMPGKPSGSSSYSSDPRDENSPNGSRDFSLDLKREVPFIKVVDESSHEFGVSETEGPLSTTTVRDVKRPVDSSLVDVAIGESESVSYVPMSLHVDIERSPGAQTYGYTHRLRQEPAQTFVQQLKPYHGRLNNDKWFKVMLRPFILFAYPAILWSSIIYSCSIGWLIVMSETLAIIYRDPKSYNFTALQTGLVYISPFVGGILGTGVAGKVSDIIVRAMARRNGGLYEPEYRLVMVVPIVIATGAGLIGFGWAAEEKDAWIVPTIFFGIVSFGCSLGSTTSITFCVDSYRQYAGEALVTLNFSKNIFHGLVFSLFVSHWLAHDGSKRVYMWLGIIQIVLCLLSIPMYIFGKRARMWTVRKNWMEKL